MSIKELQRENKELKSLLSIISHDIRSPLNALMGLSKYITDEIDDLTKKELSNINRTIYISSKKTFRFLENMLELAKIRTDNFLYTPQKIEVKKMIDDVLDLFSGEIYRKNLELRVNGDLYTETVSDKFMLSTALRNLISNAIKYSFEDGEIFIHISDEQKETVLTVKDYGVGIDKDKINKIFEVRSGKSTPGTRDELGSGLGLILTKELLDKCKCKLIISSEPNKETKAIVRIPNNIN